MSNLSTLLNVLWCPGPDDYPDPTPEEIEAQRQRDALQKEAEKHTMFGSYQFDTAAKSDDTGGAKGVKVLRDKNGVLIWMDTNLFPFHYSYCVALLGETRPLPKFNEEVYTGKDRSMLFGTVMRYPGPNDTNYYCVELNPADPMTELEVLDKFFQQLKENFKLGETLHFHPTSGTQINAIKGKKLSLPILTSQRIYGGIKYKCIQTGLLHQKPIKVFAEKKYTEKDLETWLMQRSENEIVVIPSVPADIPVVAGVICGEIIPPLCHVALLCQNRKTPCCFAAGCVQVMHDKRMHNLVAEGIVAKTGYLLDADGSFKVESPVVQTPKIVVPQPNNQVKNLIDLHEDKQHATDVRTVGAKAAQLAKVESIYKQKIFDGTFVIPFYYYEKHVYGTKEISDMVNIVVKDAAIQQYRMTQYEKLRNSICSAAIDPELVQSVIEQITNHKMTSVILRSSTNAEDLTGFNGAGLYESIALKGNSVHDPKEVGNAIKKIFASVWSAGAVKERQHYRMDHKQVNMAIIVQRYIETPLSDTKVLYNGVCITHDVARHKLKHGFVVNCFPGTTMRVTNHYKNKLPEHTVLALGREENSIDVQLTTPALDLDHGLVTQADAEQIVKVFGELHNVMLGTPHRLDNTVALDIEFMMVEHDGTNGKRELIVLQARPYVINVETGADLDEMLKPLVSGGRYLLNNSYYKKVYAWTLEY